MNIFDYIGTQFRKPTGFWGNVSTLIMNIINRNQYKAVEKVLELKQDENVLDIGFGNGFIIKKLSDKYKSSFYGIDISEDMVKIAQKKNPTAKLSQGDVNNLNFSENFFEKIYTMNTVYFWSDLSKGLEEIFRVLKDNGVFINSIKSKEFLNKLPITRNNFEKYTVKELVKASENCGFSVEVKPFSKDREYCIICRKVRKLNG
ncbi:MAG: class I SAM-dependent methyltransferase [Oscillospiraceae bacterium]|jgi:ubiquinone/menaquinone biosynthesis C-methylase UbiE|nr:class I SAM-dependent methyltransferase [Oscillospiraceae bacterium]